LVGSLVAWLVHRVCWLVGLYSLCVWFVLNKWPLRLQI
jgi:hypothetical protein